MVCCTMSLTFVVEMQRNSAHFTCIYVRVWSIWLAINNKEYINYDPIKIKIKQLLTILMALRDIAFGSFARYIKSISNLYDSKTVVRWKYKPWKFGVYAHLYPRVLFMLIQYILASTKGYFLYCFYCNLILLQSSSFLMENLWEPSTGAQMHVRTYDNFL